MGMCFYCKHRSERDKCSFIRIPKSPCVRKKWVKALRRPDGKEPGDNSVVCTCHLRSGDKRRTPVSLNPSPKLPRKSTSKCRRRLNMIVNQPLENQENNRYILSNENLENLENDGVEAISNEVTVSLTEMQAVAELRSQLEEEQKRLEYALLVKDVLVEALAQTREELSKSEAEVRRLRGKSAKQERNVVFEKEILQSTSQRQHEDVSMVRDTVVAALECARKEVAELKKVNAEMKLKTEVLNEENGKMNLKIKSMSIDLDLLSKALCAIRSEKLFLKKEYTAQTERLHFRNLCNDENVAHYTGLPNTGTFYWLLSMVPENLKYYYGSKVRGISREDQLFITLLKLRRNITHQMLSDLFQCSTYTISNIVMSWVSALHVVIVRGVMKTIPSLDKVKLSMPDTFNEYPNCRMILDCTEVSVQIPGLLSNHNLVYSNYKSKCTFKGLVVVVPNGTVVFASKLYPGSTSDKVIVQNCGILDHLQPGDAVMADKGFLIKDLLPPGVSLNLPPFKETPQFTGGQIAETLQIARARIHVERAIQRIKTYQVLNHIPHSMFQYATEVFQVCGALCNFREPLIKEVGDKMK